MKAYKPVAATRNGRPAHTLFSGRMITPLKTNREWLEERRQRANRNWLTRLFRKV